MALDLFVLGYARLACAEGDATALFEAFRQIGFSPKALERDEKNGKISFLCSLRTAKRLRGFSELAFSEEAVGGLPILGGKLVRRPGLLCGILMAIALLIVARLFVWEIEITGHDGVQREELLYELSEAGLSCGSFLPALDTDEIALALRQGDSRIAYATVNMRGTVAHVQIREAVERDATAKPPADLVATRDGVISMPLAFEGECLVREGDVVRAGQVLVSGVVGNAETGVRYTRAAGQILARTTHVYTVTVPLVYEEKVYTDEVGHELCLHFFGFQGIFFKTTGNIDSNCDIIVKDSKWELATGRQLPLWITATQMRAYEWQTRTRTAAEAYALAKTELEAQLAADSQGRALLERRVETRADADGLTLICTVVCEEDIARTAELETTPNF